MKSTSELRTLNRMTHPTKDERTSEQLCEAKHAARAKQQFAQIRPLDDGGPHAWATIEMRDVEDMTAEGDWEIRHVWLTRDEFETLPDFGGW